MKKLFYKLTPDLGEPMQLVADTGDTSADGEDLVTADEAVTAGGADFLAEGPRSRLYENQGAVTTPRLDFLRTKDARGQGLHLGFDWLHWDDALAETNLPKPSADAC